MDTGEAVAESCTDALGLQGQIAVLELDDANQKQPHHVIADDRHTPADLCKLEQGCGNFAD